MELNQLVREAYTQCLKKTPTWGKAVVYGQTHWLLESVTEESVDQFVNWCRDLGLSGSLDPVAWVFSMFESRRYSQGWMLPQLQAKGHLDSFRHMEWKHLNQALDLKLSLEASPVDAWVAFDPYGAETVRKRYAQEQNPEGCLGAWPSLTRGYHPRSNICPSCRMKEQCRSSVEAARPGLIGLRERWSE